MADDLAKGLVACHDEFHDSVGKYKVRERSRVRISVWVRVRVRVRLVSVCLFGLVPVI